MNCDEQEKILSTEKNLHAVCHTRIFYSGMCSPGI